MKKKGVLIFCGIIFVFFIIPILIDNSGTIKDKILSKYSGKTLRILSSNDNKDLEKSINDYAEKEGFKVKFTYSGDLDIADELNVNSDNYDAVWISNSLWLYMVNDSKLTSELHLQNTSVN